MYGKGPMSGKRKTVFTKMNKCIYLQNNYGRNANPLPTGYVWVDKKLVTPYSSRWKWLIANCHITKLFKFRVYNVIICRRLYFYVLWCPVLWYRSFVSSFRFSAINTNLLVLSMLTSKVFTAAGKSYFQWGSIWWSMVQESNAQPTELIWYVPVRIS